MLHFFTLLFYSLFLVSCNVSFDVEEFLNDEISQTSAVKIKKCEVEKSLNNPSSDISVQTKYLAQVYTVENAEEINPRITSTEEEKNIRHANYSVLNSLGAVVYCGNTGELGAFNILLESDTDYKIRVYSHIIFSDIANVAVMNNPSEGKPYYIEKSFNTSDTDSLELVATINDRNIRSPNQSAAFNILDQFVKSNLFLKTNTEDCTSCTAFSNTPFLEVYWTAGLNPKTYLEPNPTSSVSFFINFQKNNRHYYRIFILGGMNGVSTSNSQLFTVDTDEFDNSVVIHEYAHFLTTAFSKDTSPGGPHSGLESLDPRLAWSEGFANFFQAAVLNKNFYLDVIATGNIFFPLENQSSTQAKDKPSIDGEGNYREFSITRFLWDIIDSPRNYISSADDDGYSGNGSDFQGIWNIITSDAFKNSFTTSVGLFNEIQSLQSISPSVPWDDLRDLHLQHNSNEFFRSLYGLQLSHNCTPSQNLLQFSTNQAEESEQYMRTNKQVLEYYHPTTGTASLALQGSGMKFYIQNFHLPMKNIVSNVGREYTHQSGQNTNCTGQGYDQCLDIRLRKGHYLIEVILDEDVATPSTFKLFANQEELCGEHTSNENLASNFVSKNSRQPASYKLSAPFNLNLTARAIKEQANTYKVTATFVNNNLQLKNLKTQWKHSKNISIISGNLQKHFSTVNPHKKISVTLLIKTTTPLDIANIYFTAKADYKNRSFPKALVFNLKQLIQKSLAPPKVLFQKSTIPKDTPSPIIHY